MTTYVAVLEYLQVNPANLLVGTSSILEQFKTNERQKITAIAQIDRSAKYTVTLKRRLNRFVEIINIDIDKQNPFPRSIRYICSQYLLLRV